MMVCDFIQLDKNKSGLLLPERKHHRHGKIVFDQNTARGIPESVPALLDILAGYDPDNGLENDPDIREQKYIPGINKVAAQPPVERNTVSPVHLGHSGQSGADGAAFRAVAFGENSQLLRNPWPGTYKGHVTLDDIDQLGQSIQGIVT